MFFLTQAVIKTLIINLSMSSFGVEFSFSFPTFIKVLVNTYVHESMWTSKVIANLRSIFSNMIVQSNIWHINYMKMTSTFLNKKKYFLILFYATFCNQKLLISYLSLLTMSIDHILSICLIFLQWFSNCFVPV